MSWMNHYQKKIESEKLTKASMAKLLVHRDLQKYPINKTQAYSFLRMINKIKKQFNEPIEANSRCFCKQSELEEIVDIFFKLYDEKKEQLTYDD